MPITVFTTLETTRLRLRHFTDSDLLSFMAYRNDPEVARYQSWEGISEPEARAFIHEQKEVQPGVPGQGFQIAIELKETNTLIGDCYFTINELDSRQAEIGFTLSRAYQGHGFATEAISCFLNYAFLSFNLHRIIAITDCENAASVALLERLGMRREGHFIQNIWFKGKWGDEFLYAILKEEWQRKGIRTQYEEVIMTTSANGTVALVGAGEYLPEILPVDKKLLERVNGTPHVVVLPTASAPDGEGVPERWARMGVEHFAQLGVTAEPIMLLNRNDAENVEIAARLANANFIYFSGGKPRYLLETLQGTTSWQAILNVYNAGGVVAGCSAGAMVLGGEVFDFPQVWRTIPALGLVSGIAVIPHFDELPSWIAGSIARRRHKLIVIGIDSTTALVGSDEQWFVYGRGSVTVFTKNGKKRYTGDEAISLDIS